MHPKNLHKDSYDFKALTNSNPPLKKFVFQNEYGTETINFADSEAVLQLNKALLKHHYKVDNWSIPKNYLCPPIPGRADYIHHLYDLLSQEKIEGEVKGIDIGVGANVIYPILASRIYGWKMLGTDIESKSVKAAVGNVSANGNLAKHVEIKMQNDPGNIFEWWIRIGERFEIVGIFM